MVRYIQILSVGINRNRSAAGFNSTQVGAVITLSYINNCILSEVVNAFFGFDAQIYILFIKITSNRISNNSIVYFVIFIEALTRCLRAGCISREADIAGLQGCGRSSQAGSNLDSTCQLAIISGVEELLCQLVKNFINGILVFSLIIGVKAFGDTLIISDKRNIGAVISLTDGKASTENIRRIISIMVINNIGIAAVLSYIDIACIVCHNNAAIITGEGSKLACTIYIPDRVIQLQVHSITIAIAVPGCIIQISVYSVAGKIIAGPGCTVSHIKVNDACTAAVSIAYITLPEGFPSIQTNAYICTCTGTIHAAAEIYIAFHMYIIVACTNDSAFGILLNIHINLSTVLGSEFAIGTDSIFSPINSLDDATANLNLGSNCTDCFVGTGSIALISQNINKTVNSDSRHNAAYTVNALDNCSICQSSAVSTQGKYIISTGIVNINRSSSINE